VAFGGTLSREDSADVLRFANRVPLLYQPRACAIHEAVLKVDWKSYGLQQRKGELPVGPLAIFVHLASVWVPFTSEAKEAVAHYDEVVREIRLALMECGRKLGTWVKAQQAERWETQRKTLFEKYIVELAASIHSITKVSEESVKKDFEAALPNHVRIALPPVEGGAPSAGAAVEAGSEGGSEEGAAEAEASAAEAPAQAQARPSDRPPDMSDDGEGSPFEDVTPGNTRQLVLKMRPKSGRK